MNYFKKSYLNEVESAPCAFTSDEIMVICYIDDISMFSKHKSEMNTVKQKLGKDFTLRDLRERTHLLGTEINRSHGARLTFKRGNLFQRCLKIMACAMQRQRGDR